jgi:hypothetical protein
MSTKQTRNYPARGKRLSPPKSEVSAFTGDGEIGPTHEERQRMVAEAAYYRALQRGFSAGGEMDDWLAAEREIDRRFAEAREMRSSPGTPAGTPPRTRRKEASLKASRSQ